MIALNILYGYMIYYVLATIGISIGYHTYFSHKEFKSSPWMEYIMLVCGLICGGKSVLNWCVAHRMHHLYTDTEKDPHSPKHKGLSVLFCTWKMDMPHKSVYKDLVKNPRVMWFHRNGWKLLILLSLLAMLLGIFVEVIVIPFIMSYIGYGVINYFGHKDGKPVDRMWLNLIAPGEGSHEQHHKFAD